MTRINVIPVWELSDQHLLAEYRELPRVLKQNISTVGAKSYYHLGPGHMKWGRRHWHFCLNRFRDICKHMPLRGFFPKFNPENLLPLLKDIAAQYPDGDYEVNSRDIQINRERILERYRAHPDHYTWTRVEKPYWVTKGDK